MENDSDLKTKLYIAKLTTKSFEGITPGGILPDDPEIVYRPLKLLQEILIDNSKETSPDGVIMPHTTSRMYCL